MNKLSAIEGWAIVTHYFIQCTFYNKQLLEMAFHIMKGCALDLKYEWKFTEVIRYKQIQLSICIKLVHHHVLSGLLWHIMSL